MLASHIILYLILALVVSATTAFFYYKNTKVQKTTKYLLIALRAFVIFLLLVLVINPTIKYSNYVTQKPELNILVDNSSSLHFLSDSSIIKSEISKFLQDQRLHNKFDTHLYSFSNELDNNSNYTFTEKNTNIANALKTLDQIATTNATTILISDGNQTIGNDYTFQKLKSTTTIYPVVVGDTTLYEDVAIHQVNVNNYAFIENEFPVEFFINYAGNNQADVLCTITDENTTVFKEQISLSNQNNTQKRTIYLQPKTSGIHKYKISVSSLPNEKNTINNQQYFSVEVLDERTNVALFTSFLHPDIGALKTAIESNQERHVDIFTSNQLDNIDFNAYQLIILYQPTAIFKNIFKEISTYDKNIFVITGRRTDFEFLNTQLSNIELLPSVEEEVLPVYSGNYSSFIVEQDIFNDLPPLSSSLTDVVSVSTIDVIAQQRVQNLTLENPLFFTTENDNNRTAFLLGENFWQWRSAMYRNTGSFEAFDELFGKIVFYLASRKKKERLQVQFENAYHSNVDITATYFDKSFQFDVNGQLQLKLRKVGDNQWQNYDFQLKENYFSFSSNTLLPGDYEFQVTSKKEASLVQKGKFVVLDYDVEKQFVNANYSKMNALATQNNGEVFLLNQLANLKENVLMNDSKFKSIQKEERVEASLINWKYLLLIIIVLLAVEWFYRKYKGYV